MHHLTERYTRRRRRVLQEENSTIPFLLFGKWFECIQFCISTIILLNRRQLYVELNTIAPRYQLAHDRLIIRMGNKQSLVFVFLILFSWCAKSKQLLFLFLNQTFLSYFSIPFYHFFYPFPVSLVLG